MLTDESGPFAESLRLILHLVVKSIRRLEDQALDFDHETLAPTWRGGCDRPVAFSFRCKKVP